MKKESLSYPLFGLIVLLLAVLACGSDNTGTKVEEQEAAPTSPPPTAEVFKAGDVIKVKGHTVVLNSANFRGNLLEANFTIENTGADEMTVSSLLSFDARDSDGTNLEQEIFDCGPGLDGTVLPGDRLKGNICWSGVSTDSAKIYYEAELFGSGAVVWEVQR